MPSFATRAGVIAWNAGRRILVGLGTLVLPRRHVSGLSLVALGLSEDPTALFDRLSAALTLIQRHDPHRAARLRRSLKRVLIVPSGAELYDHGIRSYLASADLLRTRPPEAVALALAHEATHAWLHTKRVRSTADRLDRIERLCIAQEIALARRLPDGAEWVTFAEQKLTRAWWGPQEGERRVDALATTLRVPGWLRSLRERLFAGSGR